MLINDDNTISCLSDDVGGVHLGTGNTEGIVGIWRRRLDLAFRLARLGRRIETGQRRVPGPQLAH